MGGYFDADPIPDAVVVAPEAADEPDLSDDLMAGAGDPEIEDELEGETPLVDDRGGLHQAVNPVWSLFEQLRRFEGLPTPAPAPKPDDGDDPLSQPADE